jgi:large subunit ribosomal protein L15
MHQLHVDQLAYAIRQGRIDPSLPITLKELVDSGCCSYKPGGVRLYGTPSSSALDPARRFPSGLRIIVSKASPKAIRTIEGAGGVIVSRYYNPLGVRAVVRPDAFLHQGKVVPRVGDPVRKRDLDYYADPANRGYIWLRALANGTVAPARQSPSTKMRRAQAAAGVPGPAGLENPPERRAEEA